MAKRMLVEVAGEGVVVEPESGQMFRLNETGLFVYRLIQKGLSEKEIACRLSEEYDISSDDSLADVTEFVRELREKKYL